MKRVIKLLAFALAAAGLGSAGYHFWLEHEREAGENQLVLHGNIEIRDANLAFFESEHISEVLAEEGDKVEAGQLLARLVTDRLEAEIDRARARIAAQQAVVSRLEHGTRPQEIRQARAEVSAAEARVHNAETNVERLRKTAERGASSEQALDNAQAQLEVERATLDARREALELAIEGPRVEDIAQARAQLDAARAELQLLQRRLSDSELIAPAAGIIQSRLLEPGEMASPTAPVFTLALQDPKWVRAYVPEPDLGRIRMGLSATVRSDSFPDTAFEGWVGFISPVAEFTPKNVETTDLRTKLVYEVRIYVRDPHDQLRLGQPVTVVLPVTSFLIDRDENGVAPGSNGNLSRPSTVPAPETTRP
jgi:HlyD family secretion protein